MQLRSTLAMPAVALGGSLAANKSPFVGIKHNAAICRAAGALWAGAAPRSGAGAAAVEPVSSSASYYDTSEEEAPKEALKEEGQGVAAGIGADNETHRSYDGASVGYSVGGVSDIIRNLDDLEP